VEIFFAMLIYSVYSCCFGYSDFLDCIDITGSDLFFGFTEYPGSMKELP